jgi:hypothetical protein
MADLNDYILGISLFLMFIGGIVWLFLLMHNNPVETWRGDPFKWLFVWGYRKKYLLEQENQAQIDQVENATT